MLRFDKTISLLLIIALFSTTAFGFSMVESNIFDIGFSGYVKNSKYFGAISLWNSKVDATGANGLGAKWDPALKGVLTGEGGYLQPLKENIGAIPSGKSMVFAVSHYLSSTSGSIESSIWKTGDGYIYFKTNSDGTMQLGKPGAYVSANWQPGRWYRMVFVLDSEAMEYKVYHNGVCLMADTFVGTNITRFQSKAYPGGSVQDGNIAAIDDFACYIGTYDPMEDYISISSIDSRVTVDSNAKKILAPDDFTVSTLQKSLHVTGNIDFYYDADFKLRAAPDSPLSDNFRAAVRSENGKSYDYYDIETYRNEKDIILYNETTEKYIESIYQISDNDVISACLREDKKTEIDSAILVLAYYRGDVLCDIVLEQISKASNNAARITIPKTENSKVVAMLLGGIDAITPLTEKIEIGANFKSSAPTTQDILAGYNQVSKNIHPRILATKDRFDGIYSFANSTDETRNWYNQLILAADNLLGENTGERAQPIPYGKSDGTRLDGTGTTMNRSISLAFAYYTTKDEKYARLLWELIEPVCSYPDWNQSSHFLCTATLAFAFAVAYDWCYDYWSDEQKNLMADALAKNVHLPALELYRSLSGWTVGNTNWNAVCNSGVAMSALAIMDEKNPEICAELIARSINSSKHMLQLFAPDGAWFEGVSYWHYLLEFFIPYISSIEASLGCDYGLFDFDGMDKTAYFAIYATGNLKQTFNFHDSSIYEHGYPEFFWIGQKVGDDDIIKYRLNQLRLGQFAPNVKDFLWLEPKKINLDTKLNLPYDNKFRDTEVAAFRNSFNKDAAYAAIHGGQNTVAHGQLDIGQFVYEANGERWAEDLGGDNYNLAYYWIMNDGASSRWSYYRNRAEGHNTVVLSPQNRVNYDQDLDAFAKITGYKSAEGFGYAILDTTSAYKSYVERSTRGVYFNRASGALIIQDEIDFKDTWNKDFYWFMHTKASVSISKDAKTATLSRNGKKVYVRILSGGTEGFKTVSPTPFPWSPNPNLFSQNIAKGLTQNANNGYRKLQIHNPSPSKNYTLSVILSPTMEGLDKMVYPISSWQQIY